MKKRSKKTLEQAEIVYNVIRELCPPREYVQVNRYLLLSMSGLSEAQVRRCIEVLEEDKRICIRKTNIGGVLKNEFLIPYF